MTKHAIQKMKDSGRLELTIGQLFWHYSIISFLLFTPLLTSVDIFKYYITNTYTGVRPIEDMTTWGYIWFLPAVLFYFIQKRKLRFHVFEVSVNATIFQTAVQETAKALEWKVIKQSSTLVVAVSGFSWRSWGERITIIRDKDRILFNSICDPANLPSVTSYGMNKLNCRLFEEHLQKAASNTRLVNLGDYDYPFRV